MRPRRLAGLVIRGAVMRSGGTPTAAGAGTAVAGVAVASGVALASGVGVGVATARIRVSAGAGPHVATHTSSLERTNPSPAALIRCRPAAGKVSVAVPSSPVVAAPASPVSTVWSPAASVLTGATVAPCTGAPSQSTTLSANGAPAAAPAGLGSFRNRRPLNASYAHRTRSPSATR